MAALRLILGDQLSKSISCLSDYADGDLVLLAEVTEEATYVRHHKKKIAFLFSAMRHFHQALQANGYEVAYTRLDDKKNTGSLLGEVKRALKSGHFDRLVITEPGEHRLLEAMKTWKKTLEKPVDIRPDGRFLCTHDTFAAWAKGRKALRMEYFYRDMRRSTGLLMDGDKPVGGQWNYDADNRKKLPKDMQLPERFRVEPDAITQEVLDLVDTRFGNHFGSLEGFGFAVTAEDAEAALEAFVEDCLPRFGDFQDAMKTGEAYLFHSLLSQYINAGLLDPLAVCRTVEAAYWDGGVPLNAAEGFIRQIIGWREYIRGIYWLKMPEYKSTNYFEADRPLPDFFWTAETDLVCLQEAIGQTRDNAYAHHIQRLMVTGNFALLAGINPEAVNEWYLVVYADAYEWVELPNTHGMALFADGGVLASKPYAASGKYIDRMSDYCKGCRYSVKEKMTEDACPFNYLYWNFLMEHEDKLRSNQRMSMIYRNLDRMDKGEQSHLKGQAARFFKSIGIER
ncbi:MAG: cryptochrome/photolyase family protein [Pseudomonadota bacterium]